MTERGTYDALVVGAGPNGLAADVELYCRSSAHKMKSAKFARAELEPTVADASGEANAPV